MDIGGAFARPVTELYPSIVEDGYLDVVKTPMDLGTMLLRLDASFYGDDPSRLYSDLNLIYTNCYAYNTDKKEGRVARIYADAYKAKADELFDAAFPRRRERPRRLPSLRLREQLSNTFPVDNDRKKGTRIFSNHHRLLLSLYNIGRDSIGDGMHSMLTSFTSAGVTKKRNRQSGSYIGVRHKKHFSNDKGWVAEVKLHKIGRIGVFDKEIKAARAVDQKLLAAGFVALNFPHENYELQIEDVNEGTTRLEIENTERKKERKKQEERQEDAFVITEWTATN